MLFQAVQCVSPLANGGLTDSLLLSAETVYRPVSVGICSSIRERESVGLARRLFCKLLQIDVFGCFHEDLLHIVVLRNPERGGGRIFAVDVAKRQRMDAVVGTKLFHKYE